MKRTTTEQHAAALARGLALAEAVGGRRMTTNFGTVVIVLTLDRAEELARMLCPPPEDGSLHLSTDSAIIQPSTQREEPSP